MDVLGFPNPRELRSRRLRRGRAGGAGEFVHPDVRPLYDVPVRDLDCVGWPCNVGTLRDVEDPLIREVIGWDVRQENAVSLPSRCLLIGVALGCSRPIIL